MEKDFSWFWIGEESVFIGQERAILLFFMWKIIYEKDAIDEVLAEANSRG